MFLILPGFSTKNKEEAVAYGDRLKEFDNEIYIHEWKHWRDNSKWDPSLEVEILSQKLAATSEINVIAKSIGTYIACKLIPNLKIKTMILMGIPINDLTEQELQLYKNLQSLETFYVIANNNDPHGNVVQVTSLLEGFDYRLIVKESIDHTYPYIEDILALLAIK